jgi:uncharacterized protein (DUF2147 family)
MAPTKTLLWTVSLWLLGASLALAQNTPVGLWRNVDDKTGESRAEIRISSDAQGVLTGSITKTLRADAAALCTECSDDRHDKPIIGLEIIRGARRAADQDVWTDGQILDPDNGKNYTLRLTPLEGGRSLQVRGYIGPFYRTQIWQRVQ